MSDVEPLLHLLPDRTENFMLVGKLELIFLFDQGAIHPNGEFSDLARRIEFHFDSGFVFDESRHTGGEKAIVKSDFAEADRDRFQCVTLPFIRLWMGTGSLFSLPGAECA
jgi:hypothetical protein